MRFFTFPNSPTGAGPEYRHPALDGLLGMGVQPGILFEFPDQLLFGARGPDGMIIVACVHDTAYDRVVFMVTFPLRCPLAHRVAMVRLLERLNLAPHGGSFLLDLGEGDVTFLLPLPLEGLPRVEHARLRDAMARTLAAADFALTPLTATALGVVPANPSPPETPSLFGGHN